MLNRATTIEIIFKNVLDSVAAYYGTTKEALKPHEDYLGCQNLVFDYEIRGQPMVLRISFRPDRPLEQIKAEVDFINYLSDHGVRVSRAVPSLRGNLVETVSHAGQQFILVSFVKGKGMRVPDNQYRYRSGVSIDEYCQNWGQILGQMHRLTLSYRPAAAVARRPDWMDLHGAARIDRYIPQTLPTVRQKLHDLLAKLDALPKPQGAYGLIHGDFNDGNFTVDYANGDITAFDFDDACYGWFMYELASAWEGGIGRTMFEPDAQRRKDYMDHYFAQVMAGYEREHTLPAVWLETLPTFIKVIEMESLVERLAYWADHDLPIPEEEHGTLAYLIHCIERDIPYLGFYDPVFSHEMPFELEQNREQGIKP